jgi:F-type H+-transporting ATPase subunit gamma
MPSLIDIRRRIRSVRNTQQITKAMKMVSAAKLRRAQDRVIASRPYAAVLHDMLSSAAAAARNVEQVKDHPLLAAREERRIQLVLLTSDRGLAGAFNTNLLKGAQKFLADHAGRQVEIEALGRKGRDFFRRRNAKLSGDYTGLFQQPLFADIQPVARKLIGRYENAEIDSIYLLFNEFKSVLSQKLTVTRILPFEFSAGGDGNDYIFEQPPEELFGFLLPRYLEVRIYQAVLESAAAEHAARMTAMDAASSNAAEVIEKLTLYMNRVRQASITKEIIEIVSGAAALE